jgi:hypothetical protein
MNQSQRRFERWGAVLPCQNTPWVWVPWQSQKNVAGGGKMGKTPHHSTQLDLGGQSWLGGSLSKSLNLWWQSWGTSSWPCLEAGASYHHVTDYWSGILRWYISTGTNRFFRPYQTVGQFCRNPQCVQHAVANWSWDGPILLGWLTHQATALVASFSENCLNALPLVEGDLDFKPFIFQCIPFFIIKICWHIGEIE